jgi:hypothetical protein
MKWLCLRQLLLNKERQHFSLSKIEQRCLVRAHPEADEIAFFFQNKVQIIVA